MYSYAPPLYPDSPYLLSLLLPPPVPQGVISPLYAGLQAHVHLKIPTGHLCLVPHRSQNDFD